MEGEEPEGDFLAAASEGHGARMVDCELEAAEALAGLARRSRGALREGQLVPEAANHSQGKQESRFSDMLKEKENGTAVLNTKGGTLQHGLEKSEKIVDNIPIQLCATTCQSNSATKLRPKLTEAEKEARKLRRVLANRESARQTIRRRQAMYQELIRKAADMTKENENLKKEKELVVGEYNSLKDRNEFLKAQLAKFKKVEPREMLEETKASHVEKSCSATMGTPIFLHNQPSTVPCFCPSLIPSLHISELQHASHCSNAPHRNITPCPHQGQENPIGFTTLPATPLFFCPVPWLLSFLTDRSTLYANSGTNDRQDKCSCSDTSNNHVPSNQNTRAEGSCSKKGSFLVPGLFSHVGPTVNCPADDTGDADVVSATEKNKHVLSRDQIVRPHKKLEDAFAATEARRRRKELMKLKDIHCHGVPPQY